MESKKANLVIAIAKNIVEQYRDQLQNSIEENKSRNMDVNSYRYENRVIRAERTLHSVDKVLESFERSIFDGEIKEDSYSETIYDIDSRIRTHEYYWNNPNLDYAEKELYLVSKGTERVFRELGIPRYSIYPLLLDIISRTREEHYTGGKLNESIIKGRYNDFNWDGKYKVGKLYINNDLCVRGPLTFGFLINDEARLSNHLYDQSKDLYLETDKIKNIIDTYITEEINERKLEGLDEQNNLIHDTFKTVLKVGNTAGGADSHEFSGYNYILNEIFDHDSYGGKEYYKTARVIGNENQHSNNHQSQRELELLKNQKINLERLAQLNEEEKKLNSRLLEIVELKMEITKELSGANLNNQSQMNLETEKEESYLPQK